MSAPAKVWIRALAAGASLVVACGPTPGASPPPVLDPKPSESASASAAASGSGAAEAPRPTASEAALAAMLARVSEARGLPVLAKVALRTLDRATIEKMIREKAVRELPPDVLGNETEAMVALGLVPPSYDATEGMFTMIGASIAGFYEPEDRTMYLASDLSAAERDETLAHELVHALQDQHYSLGPLFKYRPDADETLAAGHALAEGDATSAMFDVARGDEMGVDEALFSQMARESIDKLASKVPSVLRASLISPYTDGFSFVQALRRRGGFAAVDAAWRALPTTSEQVLHLDKYDAREPAIALSPPPGAALARPKERRSFGQVYTQVLGEQGLRIVLEAWTDAERAARAAAGWGGDRYVLLRGEGAAAGENALAWHLRFDTESDAREMATVLASQAHGDCVARPDVGPFAWSRAKRDVALVMGPYLRTGKDVKGTGTCKEAKAWLASILAADPDGAKKADGAK